MRQFSIILLFNVLGCIHGWAADEFDTVKCGADVPKAMVGKRSSDERVVIIEARHSNLGLNDLGGTEISDRLFLISWRICGSEYAVLVNTAKHLVRDVIPVPTHSLLSPQSFVEGCQVAGKRYPTLRLRFWITAKGRSRRLALERLCFQSKSLGESMTRQERFVPMATQGLICAVSGSSADGPKQRFAR